MSAFFDRLLPPVAPAGPDGVVKPSRMMPEERQATAALGIATAVVCVALVAVLPRGVGGGPSDLLMLGLGFVASIACIPAARVANRYAAGAALLAAGLVGPGAVLQAHEVTASYLVVLPHYGVAMWMMLRRNKVSREQMMARRKERTEKRAASGPSGRRDEPTKGRGRRSAPKLPDGRPAPPPSKRYTPPRPKKRPVPPADDKKAKARVDDA